MATTVPNSVFAEIFSAEIKDKLFESNAFLSTWTNVSSYLNGRVVHIPSYTTTPTIYIDGQSEAGATYGYGFDTTATNESDLTFTIKSFRFNPFRVEDFDEMVTVYDKFQAVTRNSVNALTEAVGKYLLQSVAASVSGSTSFGNPRILTTSGATGTANGPAASAKGKLTYADVVRLAQTMDEDNVPSEGRYLQLNPQMYYELLSDPQIINALNFGEPTLPTGVVKRVSGINIMTPKPTVASIGSGGTVNAVNVTLTSSDVYAGMAWVSTSIAAAWNDPKIYTNSGVAQLYGNVVSGEYFAGAAVSRTDKKGVYLIKQR